MLWLSIRYHPLSPLSWLPVFQYIKERPPPTLKGYQNDLFPVKKFQAFGTVRFPMKHGLKQALLLAVGKPALRFDLAGVSASFEADGQQRGRDIQI
ncbi:MAG: hypothetical protein JWQ04_2377 [Pedosphaera sp.]|nr:hypothetical protein [Pedosphaera sp.]